MARNAVSFQLVVNDLSIDNFQTAATFHTLKPEAPALCQIPHVVRFAPVIQQKFVAVVTRFPTTLGQILLYILGILQQVQPRGNISF